MKQLTTLISALFFLVIGVSHVWALPACQNPGYFHNCYGTFVWDSGDKYVGDWWDNRLHGQGTYTFVNGEEYDTSEYGEKYEGEFQDFRFHGQGTLTFPDGSKWVGAWKNSQLNGYAVTYYADGSINQEGIFKDDKFLKAQTKPKAPKVFSSVQNEGLTALPSEKNFLDAIYGGKAIRRLFEVDIVSFDGFFETETIYLAEVKATIKESKLPDFLREGQWKLVFIEEGMSASEAAATVNTMRMLDSFNDGLNLFLDALGSPVNNTSSKNGSRTFTDTYRFGKGSKKWIYIPDKQTSTSSNDTYDTDFQGWVNKYSDF